MVCHLSITSHPHDRGCSEDHRRRTTRHRTPSRTPRCRCRCTLTCLRFCGVVHRCRRSSTAAAGEAVSCSVLMSLYRNSAPELFLWAFGFFPRPPPRPTPLYRLFLERFIKCPLESGARGGAAPAVHRPQLGRVRVGLTGSRVSCVDCALWTMRVPERVVSVAAGGLALGNQF